MKQIIITLITGIVISPFIQGQENSAIEDLFKLKCGICHTIGGGKLIGPDLSGIREKRTDEWLLEFIRSSQKMIDKGDPDAVALFEEYNKVQMPDPMISDQEIMALLDHIEMQSGQGTVAQTYTSILDDATQEDMVSGRHLFEGIQRFENGGPSCISCHNDLSNYFFSENSYSTKDIRKSFETLGEAGVKAILESPPFPVMQEAFDERPLNEHEVHDLLVFLRDHASTRADTSPASGYLLYGLIGAVLLLFFIAVVWQGRKAKTVNHRIFRRQISSYN